MNAATPSRFALAAKYLADFIASVFPAWSPNGCMVSLWFDGSLDQAWQAVRADDGPTALGMLALAQQQARIPVGDDDEDHPSNLALAQQERQRMHLAACVATALIHEAQCECAEMAPADEDLEPLELPEDFVLCFELPEPSAAAELNPPPQG